MDPIARSGRPCGHVRATTMGDPNQEDATIEMAQLTRKRRWGR